MTALWEDRPGRPAPDTFANGRAVPVDPDDLVETFAGDAIERWHRTDVFDWTGHRGAFRRHDPRACPCIACADGRVALEHTPLVPYMARRSFPDPTP